ncbi:diguanylate cyclase (GGDEF)-like protein [Acidovorax delafieldii]|jgi:diguanylate cyclase (GGDEF)-like protein|uniref:diguanylate cyclase n=1 Tax=Acidovorax delafieldii TaxID=47920 RepID=A0AAJ2BSI3_ACIDE|nr:GGDEF domain-containing protein [Acidovorax delafieldii]MDR6765358.1 diguanylate cyclase (GGDEF)-like protein [Acidovorax delafieldii]MDR6835796.1 diguanylate cyclase (GGDEF)-like protein [Acidovorax delafieldii]MDR7365234.1 diguanylate cyclase (GGDEF)-like protein [Acidovorax delafieldii]
MQSPSAKPQAPTTGSPRTAYRLLALVVAMALATSVALWWTLRQAQDLAQPHQQNDLWYIASVHNELARVSLLARQLRAREASAQDLVDRLDVLYSTLDTSGRGPRVSTQLREALPDTAQGLDGLRSQVERWSSQASDSANANEPGSTAARRTQATAALTQALRVAEDITRQSDALLERLRQAVATVHLFSTQQTDQARRQLHQRFIVLSVVLSALLVGTTLLIARLVQDARAAAAASRQLAQTNRELEDRVARRTRKLEESRALLGFILDTSPSDVLLAEVESGRVHFINHRLTERLGLKAAPQTLFLPDLLHDPDTRQRFMQTLDQYGQVDAMEAQIGTHAPRWSSLSARLIDVEGRLAHLLWGFDISTHKALEAQLRELATRDALSGLLNRRAFMERSTALFDHCRRHGQPCTVLMIDIDHFKRINDQHGHQMGDTAIRACADAIGQALREADLLGRLGGEEFAALLPHASADSARQVAERIRGAIAQLGLVSPSGHPVTFTISIGMAASERHHTGIEPLLADADAALYRAKATGRNRVLAHEAALPAH